MKLLYNKIFLEHDTGMHPENAKRLESLGDIEETSVESGEQYLELIHKQDYIQKVKHKGIAGGHIDDDTVVSPKSYEAAVHAVGATIMACETRNFALVRPPGHHAHSAAASGFCLFNNVAIAAQKLVNEGKKVLIFDFDGHLGDGTEKIFYHTDKVLYFSLHQFPAFPGWGDEDEIGEGAGEGYSINVPLPPGSGDDLFWKAIESIWPVMKQFAPDVVAVSAGFDAHHSDLLLNLRLSAPTFYRLGNLLRDNFPHVFATLEGGYNIDYLPRCIFNFLNGFNKEGIYFEEPVIDSSIQVTEEFDLRMAGLERNLSPYWKL